MLGSLSRSWEDMWRRVPGRYIINRCEVQDLCLEPGCQGESAWQWWQGASPSPRPELRDTPGGKHEQLIWRRLLHKQVFQQSTKQEIFKKLKKAKSTTNIWIWTYRAAGVDIWVEERGHELNLMCVWIWNQHLLFWGNFESKLNLGWSGGEVVLEDDLPLQLDKTQNWT